MAKKKWIGFDPGKSGAMCVLHEDNTVELYDFAKGGIPLYAKNMPKKGVVAVGLEKVHAMPGQGVTSMFSFGQRLGELEGMLATLEVGYDMPTPQKWQRALNISKKGVKTTKKDIHAVISKIYPQAELLGSRGGIMDGRCDALAIAHYMKTHYVKE